MRILVAGDSLGLPRPYRINDYSFDETELAVSYENTYSAIINKKLLELFQMDPFTEVINMSRRSQTLEGVYSEFVDNFFFHQPDIFILHVGIVDCWFREELNGGQRVPINKYEKYLDNILQMIRYRPLCKLIIVGICPTSKKMENRYPGINSEIRAYNKILMSKVDSKSIFYIDMEHYVDNGDIYDYLLPDDHHLNVNGNKVVASELLKIIKNIIYMNQGLGLNREADIVQMNLYFKKAYKSYSMNLDTIYNLLVTLFENQEYEELKRLIQNINEAKINDEGIDSLVKDILCYFNNSD